MSVKFTYDNTDGGAIRDGCVGKEAEIGPLIDKVAVGIDYVWFGKFGFDEGDDGGHLMLARVGFEGDV